MTKRKKTRNAEPKAAEPAAAQSWPLGSVGLVLILLATFLVYWPSINGGRLWDDDANLTKPELQSLDGLYRIWFEPSATARYYPLLHTVFWIEHKLWGEMLPGYHLINLTWHLLAALLIYVILLKLKMPGAWLAAALFAVHPVMVESVAWMCEQKNTLSTVFYLSAMLAYLRFHEARQRSFYFLAFGLFVLALLTKTATVTLPAALLVIFWWQRGKLSWRHDVLPLVPFFVIGAAAGLTTSWVERKFIGAEGPEFELTFLQSLLLAGRALWFYLSKLVWPVNLTFTYPRWELDPSQWWQWIFPFGALATTCALCAVRQRWRAPLAGWLFFCISLFPVLGFLKVYMFRYTFVADHLQYLASLGMFTLAAAGVTLSLERLSEPARSCGSVMCVFLLGTLAVLSWRQDHMYTDAVTLYRATIDRNPCCWMAHNNLGLELAREGKLPAAMEHYRVAIDFKPQYPDALNNLGLAYINLGRPTEAVEKLQAALAIEPEYARALSNLGLAYAAMGRFPESIDALHRALKIAPESISIRVTLANTLISADRPQEAIDVLQEAQALKADEPHVLYNMGIALTRMGRFPEAINQFESALQQQPDFADARVNLGIAFSASGKTAEAIEQFQKVFKFDPKQVKAHFNLGVLLAETGNTAESIAHFEAALRLQPDFIAAHQELGELLRRAGRPEQAIEHYQAAVQLKPDDAPTYLKLAQTLAQLNRSKESIATAEKALEIARSTHQEAAAEQIEEWLKHYRTELQRDRDAAPTSTSSPSNK